ncbi:MAG: hypothetical protein V2B20_28645 [Pseudomonadota bacterium]
MGKGKCLRQYNNNRMYLPEYAAQGNPLQREPIELGRERIFLVLYDRVSGVRYYKSSFFTAQKRAAVLPLRVSILALSALLKKAITRAILMAISEDLETRNLRHVFLVFEGSHRTVNKNDFDVDDFVFSKKDLHPNRLSNLIIAERILQWIETGRSDLN